MALLSKVGAWYFPKQYSGCILSQTVHLKLLIAFRNCRPSHVPFCTDC